MPNEKDETALAIVLPEKASFSLLFFDNNADGYSHHFPGFIVRNVHEMESVDN